MPATARTRSMLRIASPACPARWMCSTRPGGMPFPRTPRRDEQLRFLADARREHVDERPLVRVQETPRIRERDEARFGDFEVGLALRLLRGGEAEEAVDALLRLRVVHMAERRELIGIDSGLLARLPARGGLEVLPRLDEPLGNAPAVLGSEAAGLDDEHLERAVSPAVDQRAGGDLHG